MYDLKCDKKYKNRKLNNPDFSSRYLNLFNSEKINIIILKEELDSPTFRYRGYNVYQTMKNNKKYNVNCFTSEELYVLYELVDKIGLVIIQRARWSFEFDSFVNVLKKKNIPVLYDIDDLIYNPKYVPLYLNSISNYNENTINHMFSLSKRYEMLADKCDGFIVTTKRLYENIKNDFNKPVWIFHNYLNLEQENISKKIVESKKNSYSNEKFIIGYFSGSPSHKRDLEIAEPALIKLMNEYENIYLKIVGHMELSDQLKEFKKKGRIIMSKFVSFEELQYEIGKVDLNIVPLQDHEFNECKSELKYFEASIVNTITIAADNEVYKETISDDVDGFICDEFSWYEKIKYVYLNHDKLNDIVDRARKKCLEKYGSEMQEHGLEKMYDNIFEKL